MTNGTARASSSFKLRRMAMQREIVTRQENADEARSKLRLLEHRTRRVDRQIEACTEVLEKYRAMICHELDNDYRQQLRAARQELVELNENGERLDQELICHEQSISRCLEVSKKNRELQFATEQVQSKEAGLVKDAEIIALQQMESGDSD